jgi:hypothetical protein
MMRILIVAKHDFYWCENEEFTSLFDKKSKIKIGFFLNAISSIDKIP